jgi:Lrp/AsnC family leucine-responsive transcriptional regulator
MKSLDFFDLQLLEELQTDARVSMAELGRRIGLSTPATAERVRKMEESQVILGYHARVNPEKVGLTTQAFVKVIVAGDRLKSFHNLVLTVPEVLECHRVTGSESFILHVAVRNAAHLERVIDSLMPYVSTNTSMILASPVTWRSINPPKEWTA